jgi:large subunit ribosomal protein L23
MRPDDIIISPLLTEKSNRLRESHKYVFAIDPRANKLQVEEAVNKLFQVKALSCNIINVRGKPRTLRGRRGYTSSWKKAVITIAANEKIQIFEGA